MHGEPSLSGRASLASLAGFLACVGGVAAIGGVVTKKAVESGWYAALDKPPFQPPAKVFGPVWTGLYGLIAYSGWRVAKAPASEQRTAALALWGAQLVLNGLWAPLFFGARNKDLALVDIVLLEAVIAAYAKRARKVDRMAAWSMAPYLTWVAFATALNEEIARKSAA